MTQEEKARAYDEALERARKWYNNPNSSSIGKSYLYAVFPELKESEDEKISREITEFILTHRIDEPNDIEDTNLWLAWLEKQGEQKETLCDKCKKTQPSHSCQDITALGRCAIEKQGEQKPAVDFRAEDWCVSKVDGKIHNIYNSEVGPKFKVGDWVVLSTSDGEKVVQIDSVEYFKSGGPRYITSEGRWFGKGTKARLLTNKDVKSITIPESKAIVNKIKSWSKEDELIVLSIEHVMNCASLLNIVPDKIDKIRVWLKSLKDRYTWKPSDEQMKALSSINVTGGVSYAGQGQELINLYNDLKKLTEE